MSEVSADWDLAETPRGRAIQAAQRRYWADSEHRAARLAAMEGKCGRPSNQERIEKVLKLRAQGLTMKAIGERFGISDQAVSKMLKKHRERT